MDAETGQTRPGAARSDGRGRHTGRVSVCLDAEDDIAVTRAVHARCAGGRGVAISAGPDTDAPEALILSLAVALGVLWRVPRRLHSGRSRMTDEDRAQLEWEIAWALHHRGVRDLWVLRAGRIGFPGWRWLREVAEREHLHLVLVLAGDAPDRWQGAALCGARLHLLAPARLRGPTPPGPWWQRPSHRRADRAPAAPIARPPGPKAHDVSPGAVNVGTSFSVIRTEVHGGP